MLTPRLPRSMRSRPNDRWTPGKRASTSTSCRRETVQAPRLPTLPTHAVAESVASAVPEGSRQFSRGMCLAHARVGIGGSKPPNGPSLRSWRRRGNWRCADSEQAPMSAGATAVRLTPRRHDCRRRFHMTQQATTMPNSRMSGCHLIHPRPAADLSLAVLSESEAVGSS